LVAMAAGKIADVLVDPKPLEKNAYVVNVEAAGTAAVAARLRARRMSRF